MEYRCGGQLVRGRLCCEGPRRPLRPIRILDFGSKEDSRSHGFCGILMFMWSLGPLGLQGRCPPELGNSGPVRGYRGR